MMLRELFAEHQIMLILKNERVIFGKISDENENMVVISSPRILLGDGKILISKKVVIMKSEIVNAQEDTLEEIKRQSRRRWRSDHNILLLYSYSLSMFIWLILGFCCK